MADRAGREGLRDGPVRLAGRRGRRRRADGPGDGPAGPAADRLDAARLRRRPAAVLRRHAVRAVAAGAARHLRGVLPAVAVHCLVADRDWSRARLAALLAPRRRPGRHRLGAGPRAAVAALAGRGRRLLGAGVRHQVGGRLPAGGVRAADLLLERGRAAVVRRPRAAAPLGARRRRAGVRQRGARRPARVRRHLDRLAGARRPVRAGPLLVAVHQYTGQGHCDGKTLRLRQPRRPRPGGPRPRSPTRRASARSPSRCGRSGTTTRTSTPSTPTS